MYLQFFRIIFGLDRYEMCPFRFLIDYYHNSSFDICFGNSKIMSIAISSHFRVGDTTTGGNDRSSPNCFWLRLFAFHTSCMRLHILLVPFSYSANRNIS